MRHQAGDDTQQLDKMRKQPGFIAALDQSGGSTPGALRAYGIKEDAWSNDEQMFALVRQMRTRIIGLSVGRETRRARRAGGAPTCCRVCMLAIDRFRPGEFVETRP